MGQPSIQSLFDEVYHLFLFIVAFICLRIIGIEQIHHIHEMTTTYGFIRANHIHHHHSQDMLTEIIIDQIHLARRAFH